MREKREDWKDRQQESDGVIEGRNAVLEALRAGTPVDKIYIAKGETDASLGHIASTARGKGSVVVEADRRKLDAMSLTHAHQGVIAVAAVRSALRPDTTLEEITFVCFDERTKAAYDRALAGPAV